MPVQFSFQSGTGKTLALTLERLSDGYEWRQAATAGWEAAGTSSFANRKIALNEGAAENFGRYSASVSGLGNAGKIRVQVHDEDASNITLAIGECEVWGGNEIRSATDASGNALAKDSDVTAIKAKTDNLPASPAAVGSAMTLATDAVNAAAIAADGANKIADHVRRRTQANVFASSDGDPLDKNSEYGMIQQAQNSSRSGTTMTVNHPNDTTLGTFTLTVSSGADPITGVD